MKNTGSKKLLIFLLPLLVFCACEQSPQKLTNEESISFAKEVERSIKKGDGDFLDQSFDRKTFVKKMNLPNTADGKGFGKGIMEKMNLGDKITNSLTDHDHFQFIKHYVKEGIHHIIFRLYGAKESSLNYHDYELMKVDDKCRIADVYIYLSGETLAETMGNIFRNLYEKGTSYEKENLGNALDLKEIKKLMQQGRNAEAKKLYDELPAFIKKTKAVLLFNVMICSNLSNAEYSAAIRDFQEKFPNEPNMNLMMIDGYFLQKDYEKMLAAINALDSQINNDPLLDFYRYLSYNLLKDKDNARICLTRLLKNMPDFQKGYQELIATELEEKNTVQADSLIKIYRGKAKFNQEELTNIISYYR